MEKNCEGRHLLKQSSRRNPRICLGLQGAWSQEAPASPEPQAAPLEKQSCLWNLITPQAKEKLRTASGQEGLHTPLSSEMNAIET